VPTNFGSGKAASGPRYGILAGGGKGTRRELEIGHRVVELRYRFFTFMVFEVADCKLPASKCANRADNGLVSGSVEVLELLALLMMTNNSCEV
jgi:hypothetical protein